MPLGGAIIAGGASILGGVLGGKGAKKAAKAQIQLGREALALQGRMYDQSRADLAPWRDAGGKAIGQGYDMLQPGYDYTASPGYQFRLSEGLRGVENSAAAKGVLQSGGTLKDIDKYSQGLAAEDYGDQFNRVMAVAGGGQQAATNTGQFGQNYANSASSILGDIGNAKASGYVGQANAWQGALSNIAMMGMMYAKPGGSGGYGGY